VSARIITLTTDFGLKDPYAAEMKAVILGICPSVAIVDITHEIEEFSVRAGAYVLASAAPYFPKGTIHVAVVDPSVGTRRRPILIQTRRGFFVGPDNGVLILAAEKQGMRRTHEITNRRLMLSRVSSTFHGRDVFAPAAAHLANGVRPAEFGPEISDAVEPEFTKVTLKRDVLAGEVLHVDNFGNIITNVSEKQMARVRMKDFVNVELPNQKLKLKLCKAYGEAKPQEPIALIGSQNYLEIALNQGNAAAKFGTKPGDKIKLWPSTRI
jgi:S-adenosylmethionine hydrolase